MSICSIHQPNFFPWIGYWVKLNASTDFILYDSCPLDEQGYSRRVKLSPQKGHPYWCSQELMPHKHGTTIQDVKANLSIRNRRILLAQLKGAYGTLPYGAKMLDLVAEELSALQNSPSLATMNIQMIKRLATLLCPQTRISVASEFSNYLEGQSMLIKLCKEKEAKIYLSGKGAVSYLNHDEFKNENINLNIVSFSSISKNLFKETEINQTILGLLSRYGEIELKERLDLSKKQTHKIIGA